jgi:hypothetical protein
MIVTTLTQKFRDRMEQTNLFDLDPSQWTPEQLDAIAQHLIREERGNLSPAEMESVKAELLAAADETAEASFARTNGQDPAGAVAAPDTDWFDDGNH